MSPIDDREWLMKAIELSRLCPPSQKAFSVGAIIVGANGDQISTGYSRERNPRIRCDSACNKASTCDRRGGSQSSGRDNFTRRAVG